MMKLSELKAELIHNLLHMEKRVVERTNDRLIKLPHHLLNQSAN